MGKTSITCALTGAQQGKEANPNLPKQPTEIIQQGLDAWRSSLKSSRKSPRSARAPAAIGDLQFLISKLPQHANWHVTGIGARNHFRITTAAVLPGGHLRVGMEDNVYIGPGELAKSNAQLVEKSVCILQELGEAPASPEEAKTILGFKAN